jgi:predicted MFS family arabinose efflux permease
MLMFYSLREVVGIDPMLLLVWFTPMAVGGCILAVLGGYLMSKVSGTGILIVSCLAVIAAATAFLYMPSRPSYWAWVFPAMICATTAIDLVYSVVNVFLSSELSEDQQGMAGSLAHALVRFSDTLLLGVARGVTADGLDTNDRASYRGAFWLQVACEVGALCIVLLYVRIGKAGADEEVKGDEKMLDDEYQELSISK